MTSFSRAVVSSSRCCTCLTLFSECGEAESCGTKVLSQGRVDDEALYLSRDCTTDDGASDDKEKKGRRPTRRKTSTPHTHTRKTRPTLWG